MTDRGVLLWDFDGTLAWREHNWRGAVVDVLDEHYPGHGVDPIELRAFLSEGFPWHRPDMAHPELSEPSAWWEHAEAVLARAFRGVGHSPERSQELARLAHEQYINHEAGWELFPDTMPTLDRLREQGWRHVVVSNHVPELPALIAGLGLAERIDLVLSSATTGYEKPHPEAFRIARQAAGNPPVVWMIGDNPIADVEGAEAVGIPAILVRSEARPHAERPILGRLSAS
jgi:putative hydrolase of the HAD superfamily